MAFVFKISGALLLAALAGGQMWLHNPASENQRQEMVQTTEACPVLAPVDIEDASQFDAISLRDAYWRKLMIDAVSSMIGDPTDSCHKAA